MGHPPFFKFEELNDVQDRIAAALAHNGQCSLLR